MKSLLLALLLIVTLPAVALAQGPADEPETPYHFEPIEIPEPEHQIPIDIANVDFINQVGSYALTVFTLLDKYNVLGIFVVILVGLSALWWLYSFVTDKPVTSVLNLSGGLDLGDELADGYYDSLYKDAENSIEDADDLAEARRQIGDARSRFRKSTKAAKSLTKSWAGKEFRF
jgi:hypothetical protein